MTPSRLLLAAAVVLAVLASTQSAPAQGGAPPIGSTRIGFSSEHLDPNSFHLRAFVATDSASPNCLVTMNESNFCRSGNVGFLFPENIQRAERCSRVSVRPLAAAGRFLS